jgi:hypothetical protein
MLATLSARMRRKTSRSVQWLSLTSLSDVTCHRIFIEIFAFSPDWEVWKLRARDFKDL